MEGGLRGGTAMQGNVHSRAFPHGPNAQQRVEEGNRGEPVIRVKLRRGDATLSLVLKHVLSHVLSLSLVRSPQVILVSASVLSFLYSKTHSLICLSFQGC